MNNRTRLVATVAMACTAVVGTSALPITPAHAVDCGNEIIFATTDDVPNRLFGFYRSTPATVPAQANVTGLAPGEDIVGLDLRPLNNKLYAVTSQSRLYTLAYETVSSGTVVATQVGTGQFTPLLNGSEFGLDVNPVADRLRLVSDTGQNLRINMDTGVVQNVDSTLTWSDGSAPAPRIVGTAYSNSDNDPATGTTQYVIDSRRDVLSTVANPNSGVITSTGNLGWDTSRIVGFDITCGNQGVVGSQLTNDPGVSSLFDLDLTTGVLSNERAVGGGAVIRTLTVVPATVTPQPVIPEVPVGVMLSLSAAAVLGGVALFGRTRRLPA